MNAGDMGGTDLVVPVDVQGCLFVFLRIPPTSDVTRQ